MKKLLTIAFIVTSLYACGGGFTQQDKSSVEKAPRAEQSAKQHAAVEKKEAENSQVSESKTDSAINMAIGLAKSMF